MRYFLMGLDHNWFETSERIYVNTNSSVGLIHGNSAILHKNGTIDITVRHLHISRMPTSIPELVSLMSLPLLVDKEETLRHILDLAKEYADGMPPDRSNYEGYEHIAELAKNALK